MSPKTTLSWLGAALGVPAALLALMVPVREAGSLLLQVWVAGWVDRMPRRKWAWVAGSVAQGACVLGMALVAASWEGAWAGAALLALLAVFAGARSVCSLASKDVLGRVLPASQRGSAGGWASAAAGVATLLVAGGGLLIGVGREAGHIVGLLIGAGLVWWAGAAVFAGIPEPIDEAARSGSGSGRGLGRLALLREDPRLVRFVVARTLMLCSALSAPYYVMLAQRHPGAAGAGWLGFVLLGGLASLLAGPLWGRWANRSSRRVMAGAVSLASVLGLAVCALAVRAPAMLATDWLLPGAFFLLCVAHEGVRIGRKTWIVNVAEGQLRRDYVAVSNSAMGVMLLVVGAASAGLAAVSLNLALLALTVMGAVGAALLLRLPEAESPASASHAPRSSA